MEYTEFTEEQQYGVLQQKLRAYEIKHFEASLNVEVSVAANATQSDIDIHQKAVDDFATCIEVVKGMLAELPVPEPVVRPQRPQHPQRP